ncbi:MAG: ribosome-associated translation inhibitor RaiA [Chloroflexota bacterium]
MRTTVKARNFEMTDRLRGQIERKLQRLERVAHADAQANVELIAHASRESDSANTAEVTLVNNGTVMRSVAAGPTLLAALNGLIDKLERQVVRARERPRSVRERHADEGRAALARAAQGTVTAPEADPEQRAAAASVVKIKRFDMVPMFEEDAVARMEELGHAFFVFLNAETDGICVVYRRRGRGYGLIEPVLAPERRGG